MKHPSLYRSGQRNIFFCLSGFFGWFVTSIYHSLLIYFLVALGIYSDPVLSRGCDSGLYLLGTVIYCCVFITVTGKIALMSTYWTVWNHVLLWGSLIIYFVMVIFCGSFFFASFSDAADLYEISTRLLTTGQFYFTVLLVPFTCLLRDIAWRFYQRTFTPLEYHLVQDVAQENFSPLEKWKTGFFQGRQYQKVDGVI